MLKIGIVVVIIFVLIFQYYHIEHITQPGTVHSWNVVADYHNSRAAAKLLDVTNSKMIKLMRILREKYSFYSENIADNGKNNSVNDKKLMVEHLLTRYNPEEFYENDPKKSSKTSYTINKGDSMYICMRDRNDPTKLVDDNLLMFVHLHESAHIANYSSFGHDERFWEVFKFILIEAVLAGVYRPVDYRNNPVMFCGLNIDHNPLFDNSIAVI